MLEEWGMKRIVLLFIIIFFSDQFYGFGQDRLSVSTKEIDRLINEWNFANNQRSFQTFQSIYAPDLLFYTQRVNKEKAIQIKQELFSKSPDFQQKLIGQVRYIPYTSGVTKCVFVKEVPQGKRAKRYNAYLLVSYDQGKFLIVGESDEETDHKLGYTLDLGQQIEFDREVDSVTQDSVVIVTASTTSQESRFIRSPVTDMNSALTYVTAKEPMLIRRDYIFILVGLLLAGGMLIVVADTLQGRSSRRKPRKGANGNTNEFELYKLQTDFQKFVVTLFDPLYFRHKRIHPQQQEGEPIASLVAFDFQNKQAHGKFVVQTVYVPQEKISDIHLLSRNRLSQLYHYQKTHAMDVYVIVGLGGQPDDPREVFLLPANMLHERVTYEGLKPYRKSGMFFYHADGERLV
jgi:hypothetical protein